MGIVFKGGTIITASEMFRADVLVEGESIAQIGHDLPLAAHTVVDCTAKYLMPGGVDVHTHLHLPLSATASNSGYVWGHRAAAFGGTTTHLDFVSQPKGGTLAEGLRQWQGKAVSASIDYGFHMTITDPRPQVMAEIPSMVEAGVTSIKILMAYKNSFMIDDSHLFRIMQMCAKHNLLLMAHCENGDVEYELRHDLIFQDKRAPRYHAESRPSAIEAEATSRAIMMAKLTGCKLYIVHMTCRGAIEALAQARHQGVTVMGETCPQYLLLSLHDLAREGFEGAKYVCSPPLRTMLDQERLWQALRDHTLQVVATDHCDFWYDGGIGDWIGWSQTHDHHDWDEYEAQDPRYRRPGKELGREDFSKIPNGLPGIEDRMKLLWHFGVNQGRISPTQFVALNSTNPAMIFGLHPRKGSLMIGADADLLVWDPQAEWTIRAATHHMKTDYNCYEGMSGRGLPEHVYRRGVCLVEGDDWRGEQGSGKFIVRHDSGAIL